MEEKGFFQVKFNYAGYFKTVKTACGLRYCDGKKHSLMIDLDGYNLFEFCRDVRSLWDWGVTENIGVCEGGEGDDDGQVAEETVGEGVGEGVGKGVDEGIGEGVGEDIGGAIGENVGQVAEEVVGEDIGENIGESFGEDVGQVAEEPAGQSDAVLSEDSYRLLNTDDSDVEDNMDPVETFSYDVNNPIMEVGAKYPNVSSFRDALTHFALLNEFEYNLKKSDLLRVTATCAKSNCKWRIHASRLQDSLDFQVKTLQGEHTCTSANRCRNKVATQSWVCNRVIGWLRLDRNQGLRPAGRPRNKRIRASDEMAIRKRHRCKRCNKLGHRAKTCKNPVDVNQQAAAGPSETANQQPAAGPSQAANQQPAAAGNQQPTGPPQVGNQHSRAPIQAENQQAGDPHSEPPSQTSISSGKRRRGKRVASRSRYLQSQDGSTISEIDALGSLEN
uniref:CCHC-type domain-containing protein n=1 Tax=Ananas comosus var. bracteatus TaxID=296719 RepID=A0A6V7QP10_ANACO|nr:unnamed protein product [Ananas comosus var. bracteatus]